MKYSSVSAFVEHYLTLRKLDAAALGDADRKRLTAINEVLGALRKEERAAVESDRDEPAIRRHRDRAMLHLRRELASRGILEG